MSDGSGRYWILGAAFVLAVVVFAFYAGWISVGPTMLIAIVAFFVAFELNSKIKVRASKDRLDG